MKKTILILACGMSFLTGFSQELPKWANKAKKAVFSVITYNKDNQILNTGNGFYIDEQGTAVSDYSLFKGADHAVIVTADGKELPVKYIMGANDIYDVVKFKTEFDKRQQLYNQHYKLLHQEKQFTCFPTQHRSLPTDRMERLPRLTR